MDITSPRNHSFIIRIWLEETKKGKEVFWRGHITHYPGEEREYVEQLEHIVEFIKEYVPTKN